ncbi:hypothetical protein FRC01_013276 [Tulasnella sp. 417]|nr:hypothetical protein FRC01_013276 [Tulasnella sp. 417]
MNNQPNTQRTHRRLMRPMGFMGISEELSSDDRFDFLNDLFEREEALLIAQYIAEKESKNGAGDKEKNDVKRDKKGVGEEGNKRDDKEDNKRAGEENKGVGGGDSKVEA